MGNGPAATGRVPRRTQRPGSGAFAQRTLVATSLHSGDMHAGWEAASCVHDIAALAGDSWVLTTAITRPRTTMTPDARVAAMLLI
jgi:hypothetical protein